MVLRLFDQPLDEDFRSHRHTDADDGGECAQRKVLDAAGGKDGGDGGKDGGDLVQPGAGEKTQVDEDEQKSQHQLRQASREGMANHASNHWWPKT